MSNFDDLTDRLMDNINQAGNEKAKEIFIQKINAVDSTVDWSLVRFNINLSEEQFSYESDDEQTLQKIADAYEVVRNQGDAPETV